MPNGSAAREPPGGAVAELADFFLEFHRQRYRFDGAPIHDAMAVAHVIDPTLVETLQLQRRDRDGVGVLRRAHGRRPLARHRPAAERARRHRRRCASVSRAARRAHLVASVIVFAAIAPHGDVDLAPELRDAMAELGRRCDADVAIVVTPHNVHVEGHFAVVTAARVGEHETDRALAHAIVDALRADGLPVVGVSFGGNDPAAGGDAARLGSRGAAPVRPDAAGRRRRAGARPAARRARARGRRDRRARRVAALRAHRERRSRPRSRSGRARTASIPQPRRTTRASSSSSAAEPLDFRPLAELVEPAKADSLWQLLVLQGAVSGRAELLAYAAPTYYGMAVAVVG